MSSPPGGSRAGATISVGALAWAAAAGLFLLLRLGPTWQAPVGGAELIHLSGAWQARVGLDDDRFVPTLFQALTTLILHWTVSEVPARILAFAATATIPGALYLLRSKLGDDGALLTLLLLALDAPSIALGSSATAMGFDLAVTLWLFVALTAGRVPHWTWLPLGFAVAVAGPLPLALVGAWAAIILARRRYPDAASGAFGAFGVALGVLATSLRFGIGLDGLRVAPFDLFAAGYNQAWSTATAFEVVLLYSWPVVLGGLAAAAWLASRLVARREATDSELVLLGWIGLSLAWLLSSSTSHNAVPVVALAMPLVLLLGPVLSAGFGAMARADWSLARCLLPVAAFMSLLALAPLTDWARTGRAGDTGDEALVLLLALVAVAALAVLTAHRPSRPALLAAALAVAAAPVVTGVIGVALSAREEPIPSPVSPGQARQLRDIALQAVAEQGGTIVVHPRFRDELTWPFRDSGTLILASRVPADATVVLWPADLPAPEGFIPLEGNWTLVRAVEPPTGALDYLHWYIDRNSLDVRPTAVAVYVKAKQ